MNFSTLNLGKAIFFCLLSFCFVFNSCQVNEEENPRPVEQPQPNPQDPDECITKPASDNGSIIPNQYVVKYKTGGENLRINSGNVPMGLLSRSRISESAVKFIFKNEKSSAFIARLTSAQSESLRKDPSVEAVEPDRIISIASCYTSINNQSLPWGVKRVGSGDGSGKTIWIIDTGVDLDHPDLNVDVLRCKSFISETTPEDDHGHGTHVAGTIAAKNNFIGVVGVAANAKVVALKVMDQSGRGSNSNVIAAVNYVAQYGKAGDVVNMSVGGEKSEILDKAVVEAADRGIYFSIAAGNNAVAASTCSPARANHPNVFTVSAMNDTDTWASFSNYGNDCVDYCAPGVNIASTHKNGGYATMSGTSMATPHVAGLLLLKGKNILTDGFVKDDPDGKADPIAHK